MARPSLFVAFIVCACWTTSACHSPQARSAPDVPAPDSVQGIAANTRAAARQVEVLRQLLALDRKSLDLAELRVAELRVLAQAGRVGNADVLAGELELLERKRALLLRELELEQAQDAATADVGAPPASESPVQRVTRP